MFYNSEFEFLPGNWLLFLLVFTCSVARYEIWIGNYVIRREVWCGDWILSLNSCAIDRSTC
jgi:hypothetical protein